MRPGTVRKLKVWCKVVRKKNTDSGPLVVLKAEEWKEECSPSLRLLKYSSDSPRACLLIVIHGARERSEKEAERRRVGARQEEEKSGEMSDAPCVRVS